MLLHLLQAVIVGVDEVKGQGSGQWAASSSRWDTQKPAHTGQMCFKRYNEPNDVHSGIKTNSYPAEEMKNTQEKKNKIMLLPKRVEIDVS